MVNWKTDKKLRAEKDPEFLLRRRLAWQRYYEKPENKAKVKARAKLKNKISAGKICRGPCARCGDPNSHAHHHDYEKPLDVEWLCAKCHGLEHFPNAKYRAS